MSLLELFCHVDDFYPGFEPDWNRHLLQAGQMKRVRPSRPSSSESMTLLIHFRQSHYRDFKTY
jgi:hypothetical protein